MAEDALGGVAGTAVGVALARATETERPDRLFADPFARTFVTAAGMERPRDLDTLDEQARRRLAAMYHWIVARTRFLDDVCARAVDGGVRQVVILGAGLDTRGFRLGWPGDLDLYEVDRTDILTFKESTLSTAGATPTCRRHTVVADLRHDWAPTLAAAGFDQARPTLWLAEGLLVYLPADDVTRLLATVTELSAPGSHFGVTVRRAGDDEPTDPADPLGHVRALWHPTGSVAAPEWLGAHGWSNTVRYPHDVLVEAGRVDPGTEFPAGVARLLHAVRSGD